MQQTLVMDTQVMFVLPISISGSLQIMGWSIAAASALAFFAGGVYLCLRMVQMSAAHRPPTD